MVGARSLAMALNRLIDARHRRAQSAHRRTRAAVAGALGRRRWLSSAPPRSRVFLVAVWQLAPARPLALADPGRGFVLYPYLKRCTWLCHFWLGAVDGLAPVGAWVAITGPAAVAGLGARRRGRVWVAGFDLFYALFDVEVDREQGLHSIATRFGERGAFAGARALARRDGRAVSSPPEPGCPSAALYWVGVAAVAALLVYEHSLVRPGDLRRLDAAFFTMNGVISVVFVAFVIADAAL